jgi:hypothetical protein
MDETRARFLAAIAKQLPAERIAEVHLFAAIRQGGVESGVAVIALESEHTESAPKGNEQQFDTGATDGSEATDTLAEGDTTDADDSIEVRNAPDTGIDAGERTLDADADSPYASEAEGEPAAVAAPARPRRYVVCTARYRHTLKGPDRGKWEVTVTEEADAPLLTVDAVVRGVQRRSGDVDEIVRLSGEEVRAVCGAAGQRG